MEKTTFVCFLLITALIYRIAHCGQDPGEGIYGYIIKAVKLAAQWILIDETKSYEL